MAQDGVSRYTRTQRTDEQILDGALRAVERYGAQRVTVDDIATASGVGRATVFRRFGTREQVLERLAARELEQFLTDVHTRVLNLSDNGERTAEAFIQCIQLAQTHPWFSRLFRVEQDQLIEVMTTGHPTLLTRGRQFVRQFAAEATQSPNGSPPEPVSADLLAELLIRVALGYALFPSEIIDLTDQQQLRQFAHATVAPLASLLS